MKDLKSVTDSNLLDEIKSLACEERRITVEVLWHLREVERRRLFAQIGYPSLFEYAVRELQYSESAAFRRISAMRALKESPELESQLKSGELSVTTVSRVQTFLRKEKIRNKKTYSLDEKVSLFVAMAGKSSKEVDRKLAELSPTAMTTERERVLSETSTEIRFVAQERLMRKLERVRSLCSHRLRDPGSYTELLELMADQLIEIIDPKPQAEKQREKRKEKQEEKQEEKQKTRADQSVALAEVNARPSRYAGHSRYIARGLRRDVWKLAQGRCTYLDSHTQRRCSSTFKLQIEHKVPFAKGGSSEDPANLTLLCAAHQQLAAIQAYGVQKMSEYVPDLGGQMLSF